MIGHERERLSAYLDGELTPAERAEVEGHLAVCPECEAFLARLSAVDEAAAGLPAEAPPGYFDGFPARLRARLEAQRAPLGRPGSGRRVGPPTWTWAVAAALLLGVVTPLAMRWASLGERTAGPTASPSVTQALPGPATRWAAAPEAAPAAAGAARDQPSPARREQRRAQAPPASLGPPPSPTSAPRPKAAPATAPVAVAPAPAEAKTQVETAFAQEPAPRPLESAARQAAPETGVADAPAPVARPDVAGTEEREGYVSREEAGRRGRRSAAETAIAPAGAGFAASAETVRVPDAGEAGREQAFRRLAASRPRTVEEWRARREEWRTFAASWPDDPRADEARVRSVEAGFEASALSGEDEDDAVFRRDAAAYLERKDARQAERVRSLLARVAPKP